jgi:hypothetical protein
MVWKAFTGETIMIETNVQQDRLIRADVNMVCWFEIPMTDVARARTFYERTLGITLTPQPMGEYEMLMFPAEHNQLGAGGCLMKGPKMEPCHKGTTVYFNVTDIETALARTRQNGGEVVVEKTSIGEHGFFAILKDTEGNHVGLHSMT